MASLSTNVFAIVNNFLSLLHRTQFFAFQTGVMSQSRLEKFGTIYSRLQSLLQAGALRKEYTPTWLQVYEAFPPKSEPRWDRKPKKLNMPVPKILYAEDKVRAQFYRQFGNQLEAFDLLDHSKLVQSSLSQRFVQKFAQLEELHREKTFEELFVDTVDALELENVNLRTMDRRGARISKVKFEEAPEKPKVKEPQIRASFKDMFASMKNKESDKKSEE